MEDLNFIESHENEWKNKFIEINKDKETELKKANLFWEMLELCSHSVIADYYHKNNVQNYVWCDNWYYYNDMNIIENKGNKPPVELKHHINNFLQVEFKKMIDLITPDNNNYIKYHKLYKASYKMISSNTFKNEIVEELKGFYIDNKLIEKLDSNINLLVFDNCLYDYTIKDFRNIEKSDYVSMTTKYDINKKSNKLIKKELLDLLKSIFEKQDIINYWLESVSLAIFRNNFESFYIHTGRGGNGKGLLFSLLQNALGDYYLQAPNTFLTTITKNNDANSSLASSKGKRLIVTSEPEQISNVKNSTTEFNSTFIKSITGGDVITTRFLHQNSFSFKPLFTVFCQCNDKPSVSKMDDGIKRRFKIINYPFNFVSEPKHLSEKKIDTTLKDKLKYPKYINEFILLLLDTVEKFEDKNTIKEPSEIVELTKEYFEDNDPTVHWIESYIERTNNIKDKIKTSLLLEYFIEDTEITLDSKKFISFLKLNKIETKISGGINYGLNIKYIQKNENNEKNEKKINSLEL